MKKYAILLMVLALSACQNKRHNIDEDVRQPSSHDQSVIDVTPMLPAAVTALIDAAEQDKANGDYDLAVVKLERALRIAPQSPLVQQHLAEMQLAMGDYDLALLWSQKVVDHGPQFGRLCERARRTLALAAEMLNQPDKQAGALQAIEACVQKQQPRF